MFALLSEMVKTVVSELKISSILNDQMDINKYVKIKIIQYKDLSLSRLVRGYVFKKNIANRKMKQEARGCRVMVVSSLEYINAAEDTSLTSFDDLLVKGNEKKNVKKLIDIISKIKPNLVFVEK